MSFLRKWATPLTIGSTVIVTVTGIMLFFHTAPGLTRPAHEWIGWIMAVAVIFHLILNWRAFTTYFKRPLALGIMGVSAVVMVLSFFQVFPQEAGGGSPVGLLMGKIGQAPVETVIALSGHETNEGLALLAANGMNASPGETVAEITGGNRGQQMQVIRALFSE